MTEAVLVCVLLVIISICVGDIGRSNKIADLERRVKELEERDA